MKFKSLAVSAALVVAGSVAQAAVVGDIGPLMSSTTITGNALVAPTTWFDDQFTFSLSVASVVQSNVVTLLGNITPAGYNIVTAGADLTFGTWDDALVVGHGFSGTSTPNFDTLAAGTYAFTVFGKNNAAVSVYALGASAVAVPVPEPETYAMLAAGLGIVGFVASRRRRND